MGSLGSLLIILSSFLCLLLVLVLIKILHMLWWTPNRLRKRMALQGIKGPPYRLIHGNTKEITNMIKDAKSRPTNLSHDILSVVAPHIHSWTKLYGKNYLQWYGFTAQLIITEPEFNYKEILNIKDRAYPKRDNTSFVKKLLGDGLATTRDGEKWAKMRKIATHAFHGESLKCMFPAMVASAETMLERWKTYEGKEIEVFEEFRLFTSEVISRTAFGSSYLEGKHIFEMLMKLVFLLSKNAPKIRVPGISKFFKTSDEIESEKLEEGVRASIIEIVRKREERVMTGGEDSFGSDFLGLLLKALHDANENQRISVDDLIDECKTFYVGQETTNVLLAWTVFLLALHTEWQDEARKEVIQLFGKQSPNVDGIAKLKIMNMIINESSRLYGPVVSVPRKAEREVRLGKLILPAGTELVVSSLALHHDPQIWGCDTQLFKPERFAEGVAKATNNNIGAFIPFGIGPRTCVGLNFATNEAKIVLSMILQHYSFTLSPGYVHLPGGLMIVRPQHGVQVMLQSLEL